MTFPKSVFLTLIKKYDKSVGMQISQMFGAL